MTLREESDEDTAAVRRVVEAAFGRADEAEVVSALRNSGDAVLSLVAEEAGEICGHVLFSRLRAPAGCLALAPVSVIPARQSHGIGSRLVREGLARAKRDGWRAVFVVGPPQYYARFGFRRATAERFETAYPKPYFMALELVPDSLSEIGGAVVFPAAFSAVE